MRKVWKLSCECQVDITGLEADFWRKDNKRWTVLFSRTLKAECIFKLEVLRKKVLCITL
jgi:hypothetical protein